MITFPFRAERRRREARRPLGRLWPSDFDDDDGDGGDHDDGNGDGGGDGWQRSPEPGSPPCRR